MKNRQWDGTRVSNKKSGQIRNLYITPDTVFEMDEDCMLSRQKNKGGQNQSPKEDKF